MAYSTHPADRTGGIFKVQEIEESRGEIKRKRGRTQKKMVEMVSLLNGMSPFVGYLMPKPYLVEEPQ